MDENEVQKLRTQAIQGALSHIEGHELINSEPGVKLFKHELMNLFSEVDQIVAGERSTAHMKMAKVIFRGKSCIAFGGRYFVQLRWEAKYKNTLEDSGLWVTLCRGKPRGWNPGRIKKFLKKVIKKRKFTFHLTDKGGRRWKEVDGEEIKPGFTSEALARMAVDMLLDRLRVAI